MKTKLMEKIKVAFQGLFNALDPLVDWIGMAMPFPAGRELTPVQGGIQPATFNNVKAAFQRVKVALEKLDKHQSKWDNASDLKKFFTESKALRTSRQKSREWLRGADELLVDIGRAYNELIDIMVAMYGKNLANRHIPSDPMMAELGELAKAGQNLEAAMEGRPRVDRNIVAIDEHVKELFDQVLQRGTPAS
jgi:hypothetical protein